MTFWSTFFNLVDQLLIAVEQCVFLQIEVLVTAFEKSRKIIDFENRRIIAEKRQSKREDSSDPAENRRAKDLHLPTALRLNALVPRRVDVAVGLLDAIVEPARHTTDLKYTVWQDFLKIINVP